MNASWHRAGLIGFDNALHTANETFSMPTCVSSEGGAAEALISSSQRSRAPTHLAPLSAAIHVVLVENVRSASEERASIRRLAPAVGGPNVHVGKGQVRGT